MLEHAMPDDRASRFLHAALVVLTLGSVGSVVFESVPDYAARYDAVFLVIEVMTVSVFSLEYIARLWVAPIHPPFRKMPLWRVMLRHIFSLPAAIDLLTILPFYLALVTPADLRALIVFRIFRFLKLARYSPGIRSLYEAIVNERRALMACLVILAALILVSASLMHLIEHEAQPEKFGTIPAAMWWAVVTLTTVGYGDVVPVTVLGKLVAGFTAIMGLGMVALPVGIIATSFAEVIHRRDFVVTWGIVSRVPLFRDLDADDVAHIMRFLRSHTAVPGEIVVRRGELGHSMYFIASGQIELERPKHPRAVIGEGDFFGELAVLKPTRRTTTARALVRSDLLVLDAAYLRILMAERPELGRHVESASLNGIAAVADDSVIEHEIETKTPLSPTA
jgi:voltage-gated potassium channel